MHDNHSRLKNLCRFQFQRLGRFQFDLVEQADTTITGHQRMNAEIIVVHQLLFDEGGYQPDTPKG